jgi:hypothetical protein
MAAPMIRSVKASYSNAIVVVSCFPAFLILVLMRGQGQSARSWSHLRKKA